MSTPQCPKPGRFRVRQESFNLNLNLDAGELRKFLGKPSSIHVVKVGEHPFRCFEGRQKHHILGTIGGEFGEFLVALAEYEFALNYQLDMELIQKLLHGWIDHAGRGEAPFYLHSDEAAIEHIRGELRGPGGSAVTTPILDLSDPPAQYRSSILENIGDPKNQGCVFIKAVLHEPHRFGIRLQMAKDLLTAYFHLLWNKNAFSADGVMMKHKLMFEVLEGHPGKEMAWLNMRSNTHCTLHHFAPSIEPTHKHSLKSAFINHAAGAQVLRQKMAKYFTILRPELSEHHMERIINKRAMKVMEIMAESVGGAVPFYTVTVE